MSPMPLFELDRPLTNRDLQTYAPELALLQGNILKAHGRDAASHVFLRFRPGHRDDARQFLATFSNRLTSAAMQMQQAAARDVDGTALFVSLALTASGYRFLAGEDAAPADAAAATLAGFSDAFRRGMSSANERFRGPGLQDPPIGDWEPQFREPIHVLILLANSNARLLAIEEGDLLRQVKPFADAFVESGRKLTRNGDSIEHFGYVDATSQPLFFEQALPQTMNHWDPSAGPQLVLVRDPLGTSDAECGSYLVFRKLKQDVAAFRAARREYAAALGLSGSNADKLAGALIIGRFENGTPRAVSSSSLGAGARDNDFNYKADPSGLLACPLDAHIRIVNNRSNGRERRIVRRGMPYGDLAPDGDAPAPAERGLLFQCYQRDLEKQFEYLQAGTLQVRMDRMLRPTSTADKMGMSRAVTFRNLVTLRGGDYFFVPAISTLRRWVSS
jgi:Dyp-type peroxidase family